MVRNIFVFLFVFVLISGVEAKVLDRIVAIVNGEVITLYDLKKEIKKASLSGGTVIDLNDREVVRGFLTEMINKILFREEADKLGIKVSKNEVENSLKQIIKSNELTEEEFKKDLEKQGLTLEEVKESLKTDIKINKLISYMVRSKVVVTDEDISNYIKEHPKEFNKKQKAHIVLFRSSERHLLEKIAFDKQNKFKVLDGVKVIDMGEVDMDGLQPLWKKMLKDVESGGFSSIFRVNSSYVRLYVKEKREENPLSSPKIKDKIKGIVFREKLKKRYLEYLSKLRSKAVIEVRI